MDKSLTDNDKIAILTLFLLHRQNISEQIQAHKDDPTMADFVLERSNTLKNWEESEKSIRSKWQNFSNEILPVYY